MTTKTTLAVFALASLLRTTSPAVAQSADSLKPKVVQVDGTAHTNKEFPSIVESFHTQMRRDSVEAARAEEADMRKTFGFLAVITAVAATVLVAVTRFDSMFSKKGKDRT